MKRKLILCLAALLLLALCACGSTSDSAPDSSTSTTTTTSSPDSASTPDSDSASTPDSDSQADTVSTSGTHTLVVYFSCTGNTRAVAQTIADTAGADLYEILAEQVYTEEDLDYHDNTSRSTLEQQDPSARPAISGDIDNWADYDTVFLGFPIWWGEEPRILDSFAEQHDFTGKIVIPFCTSGGSGIGSSGSNLERLTDGALWLDGKRLDSHVGTEEIRAWLNDLGL